MRKFHPLAALVALALAAALAAPLPAARCESASASGCPLMKGAAGALCHRSGVKAAPMDCCKTKGAPAPASSAEGARPATPVAVVPDGIAASTLAAPAIAPRAAARARERAAAARHELGLFTLLAIFRN